MRRPPPVLRDAIPADVEALTDVFLAARRAAMPYLPMLHGDAETRAWLANVVLRSSRVRVAEIDGRIAGFATSRDLWLDHLYVAPADQGAGAGSALLADAKRITGTALRLHVFQRNRHARAFYLKRGFVELTFGDGSGNEEREPDLVMRWTEMT